MNPFCIFHGSGCVDGFASAWVVHRALGPALDFHEATYGQPPPDVTDRDVVIVDFSYKRPVLEAMAAQARSVLVLDHHKSAQEDLLGLPAILPSASWATWPKHQVPEDLPAVLFDMARSGAGITWDFFNPGVPRPWFINLVEDRDLWRFTDDRSRPFHAGIKSYPFDFALWDRLYGLPPAGLKDHEVSHLPDNFAYELLTEGRGILRDHDLRVRKVVQTARRTMVIGGVRVPVANCSPWLFSDVGHALSEGEPFAACYYDKKDGTRNFGLRSRPEGADVSAVAALYGGGGHHGAAGFQAPTGWEGDEG